MNKTHTLIAGATLALAVVSAATTAVAVEATQIVPPVGTLTRAEVIADLEVWRASGLAAIESQEEVDRNSAAYQAARARYLALRASPAFAARVDDIARERGERVTGVALASQIAARLV